MVEHHISAAASPILLGTETAQCLRHSWNLQRRQCPTKATLCKILQRPRRLFVPRKKRDLYARVRFVRELCSLELSKFSQNNVGTSMRSSFLVFVSPIFPHRRYHRRENLTTKQTPRWLHISHDQTLLRCHWSRAPGAWQTDQMTYTCEINAILFVVSWEQDGQECGCPNATFLSHVQAFKQVNDLSVA